MEVLSQWIQCQSQRIISVQVPNCWLISDASYAVYAALFLISMTKIVVDDEQSFEVDALTVLYLISTLFYLLTSQV